MRELVQELIGPELNYYQSVKTKLEEMIEEERTNLQDAAGNGVKPGYIRKMNYIFGVTAQYHQATEKLIRQIAASFQLMETSNHELQNLKAELRALQNENMKMKKWLGQLGKDTSLLPYMRNSDFNNYPL